MSAAADVAPRPLRRLVVQSFGSRGDIQPYVALALEFQGRGYEVHVLTNEDMVAFVEAFGLTCWAAAVGIQRFMEESEAVQKAMADGDIMAVLAAGKDPKVTDISVEKWIPDWLARIEALRPDMIVFGSVCAWHMVRCVHGLRIPAFPAGLQWVMASPSHTPCGLPHLPFGLNRLLVDKLLIGGMWSNDAEIDRRAVELHGLKPVHGHCMDLAGWLRHRDELPFGFVVAQSPQVADVLHDRKTRPARLAFTGPWVLEEAKQLQAVASENGAPFGGAEALAQLERFMAAGAKPVYMGWGSMTCKSPEHMCRLAVSALREAGCRGVVLGGFAGLRPELLQGDKALEAYAAENVLFAGKAPHEWLFPRCSCLVHHGGAGTTNAALRAGVPQVITPVFLDQFDHAYLVEKLGVGRGMRQLQKVSASDLGKAIAGVLADAGVARRATEVAEGERACRGAAAAADHIETFWREAGATGEFVRYWDEERRTFQRRREESCCLVCAR